MKLVRIKTINDRVLGNIELDFTDINNKVINNIIIAGENGVGKTRILDLIYKFTSGSIQEYKTLTNEKYTFEVEFTAIELQNLLLDTSFPIGDGEIIKDNRITFFIDCSKENGNCKIIYTSFQDTISELESDFVRWSDSRKYFISSYSTTQVNFYSRSIQAVTAKILDEKIEGSKVQNEDIATDIAQLLVDIDAQDNSELAHWIKSNKGMAPPEEVIDRKMKRFTEAFNFMFINKKLVGIENVNGQKEVIFEENSKRMNINQLSSGEKQIVFRGGFLLKDRDVNNGVVLIDEPEISLHPTWQMKISSFFRKLFTDQNGRELNQIILTTHSPFIIHNTNRQNDKVFVLRKDEKGKIVNYNDTSYYGWTEEVMIEKAFNIEGFVKTKINESDKLLIITEGKTDWIHLENAYNHLMNIGKVSKLNIEFLKYTESLGDSNLLKLYEYLALMPRTNKVVCLFDRDNKEILKKLRISEKNYKFNENNVYAMILPLPQHRIYTPEISIEHLYQDTDLKRECNGKRLYLGNEFSNKSGNHLQESDKFCVAKNKCGMNSIKVIDSDSFVAQYKDESINIALSKNDFAISMKEDSENVDFNGFIDVFKTIEEIIKE